MKLKKITAALLSMMLVLVCTSCATIEVHIPADQIPVINQNNGGGNAPAPVNPVAPAPAPTTPATPAPTTPATPAPTTPATPAPTNPATPAPTTPATPAPQGGDTTPSNGAPTDKASIVKLYQDAYNKIATDSKAVIRTYDYTDNYNKILKIGDNAKITSLAEKLMKQFMVENKEEVTLTVKDLPPKGFDKVTLNPDNYANATCKDMGTYYEVTLTSKGTDAAQEKDSPAGTGSAGSICPILDPADVTGAAGSFIKFDGLHTLYGAATATAKIDKASGHVTEFQFSTPSVLHFDKVTALGFIKVENCDIGLHFHQNWKVTY